MKAECYAIITAHNAALAAEREQREEAWANAIAAEEWRLDIEQQLAAEREHYEQLERAILDLSHPNIKMMRDELLAAQAAIATAKKRTWAMAEKWPELEAVDLSALKAHDEEVRAEAATSQLLSGNVPGVWHVKNRLGDWSTIYDTDDNIVGYAYWKADRDKIVSAHNQAIARIVAAQAEAVVIIKRELDDCDHPDCEADRKRTGFSTCAGGHLAKRVCDALAKEGQLRK